MFIAFGRTLQDLQKGESGWFHPSAIRMDGESIQYFTNVNLRSHIYKDYHPLNPLMIYRSEAGYLYELRSTEDRIRCVRSGFLLFNWPHKRVGYEHLQE